MRRLCSEQRSLNYRRNPNLLLRNVDSFKAKGARRSLEIWVGAVNEPERIGLVKEGIVLSGQHTALLSVFITL